MDRMDKGVCNISILQILINGTPTREIIPTRHIKQDDPISPLLFLICMEGFSTTIRRIKGKGEIEGIKIRRNSPVISNLHFTDDCYIFAKIEYRKLDNEKKNREDFSKVTEQIINKEKSEIIFSNNTNNEERQNVIQKLINQAQGQRKYFGLPTNIGNNKIKLFSYIEEKVINKIQG